MEEEELDAVVEEVEHEIDMEMEALGVPEENSIFSVGDDLTEIAIEKKRENIKPQRKRMPKFEIQATDINLAKKNDLDSKDDVELKDFSDMKKKRRSVKAKLKSVKSKLKKEPSFRYGQLDNGSSELSDDESYKEEPFILEDEIPSSSSISSEHDDNNDRNAKENDNTIEIKKEEESKVEQQ